MNNGVDYDAFAQAHQRTVPKDLTPIPYPRIGYAGTINRKVDLGLIKDLVARRSEWHVVVIGTLENLTRSQEKLWNDLRDQQNFHYLGPKSKDDVPAYVAHMDVNLMCYRVDTRDWWGLGYPLKMHEYLAVGKPVVSAALREVIPYKSVVDVVKERRVTAWERAIEHALAGGVGTRHARQALAAQNSWDSRLDQIEALLKADCADDRASK